MEKVDISKLSVTELKALAYDQLGELQQIQRSLQVIDNEIVKRQNSIVGTENGKTAAPMP